MSGSESRKRNLDRRRETSRYAARDRRGKEADIFVGLREVVPVVEEATVTHVDRIAMLRVAATLCKLRKCVGGQLLSDNSNVEKLHDDEDPNQWTEEMLSECIDGFVMICDAQGCILYVTESVSIYLGLTQTDLSGRQLKDFVHAVDFEEFMTIGSAENALAETKNGRMVVMRIKSVISPRGRNLNLKSAILKPMTVRMRTMNAAHGGRIHFLQAISTPAGQGNATAIINTASKINGDNVVGAFMTRHTCDMKFSYISESMNAILKTDSKTLMGTSFYDLVHPADVQQLGDSIRTLIAKGHCRTPYYRIVTGPDSVAWLQTEGTTVSHTTRGQRGQYIICVHQLIGMQNEADALTQLSPASDVCPAAVPARIVKAEVDDGYEFLGRQPQVIDCVDFTPLSITNLIGADSPTPRPFRVGTIDSTSSPSFNNTATAAPRLGARKSSYDDVLQWLFRDHPDSPAPNTLYESNASGNVGQSQGVDMPSGEFLDIAFPLRSMFVDPDPPLSAASTIYAPRLASSVSSMDTSEPACGYNTFSIATEHGNGSEFSPLATGFAECELRSSPTATGTTDYGSRLPQSADRPPRSVSAFSTNDRFAMSGAAGEHRRGETTGDVHAFVPVAGAAHTGTGINPRLTSIAPGTTQIVLPRLDDLTALENNNLPPQTSINNNDFFLQDAPDLETLAPFVPHEEMLQLANALPTDLQGLFPEISPDEWLSFEPATPFDCPQSGNNWDLPMHDIGGKISQSYGVLSNSKALPNNLHSLSNNGIANMRSPNYLIDTANGINRCPWQRSNGRQTATTNHR